MSIIIKNIKQIVGIQPNVVRKLSGKEMNKLNTLNNAYLIIKDGTIAGYGEMGNYPKENFTQEIDATNKLVFPSWCDSHTHIVYAGTRETEFVDRINGLTYQEIAEKGGGIVNSAKRLQQTSEDDLYQAALTRVNEVISMGTGAIEIKSGYGLTLDAEIKMLRVIKRLKQNIPLTIKATLLAAHAFPSEYKENRQGYIDLIIKEILPLVHQEKLADYIDVFCETNYFTVAEMEQILVAGAKYNLIPKVHVNQFTSIGGVQAGIKHNALSIDHLEVMNKEDIESLVNTNVMPTILPSCSFFLKIPYAPAREMIDKGLPVAIATDYNPGSTPSGKVQFAISLACIYQGLLPEEAINAATINSAYAMGVSDSLGSITIGKKANLFITKEIPSYNFIPYSFGENHVDQVILNGEIIIN
jgi:imidazolonepropionase